MLRGSALACQGPTYTQCATEAVRKARNVAEAMTELVGKDERPRWAGQHQDQQLRRKQRPLATTKAGKPPHIDHNTSTTREGCSNSKEAAKKASGSLLFQPPAQCEGA
eukprot:463696-Pelagomonas_calceolata.AAC.5